MSRDMSLQQTTTGQLAFAIFPEAFHRIWGPLGYITKAMKAQFRSRRVGRVRTHRLVQHRTSEIFLDSSTLPGERIRKHLAEQTPVGRGRTTGACRSCLLLFAHTKIGDDEPLPSSPLAEALCVSNSVAVGEPSFPRRSASIIRATVRGDFETDHSLGDEAACKAQLAHALEVASILRHNLAQGENNGKDDVWKLKWREDLELGDNSSIKKHKKTKTVQTDQGTVAYSKLKPPGSSESQERQRMFPSLRSLLKAHKKREVPLIKQEDIEETFIRGSGPGGQAINKTKSNVSLFHKPSGIRVTCQYSRSLEHNRKMARRILKERLDQIANPGLSKEQVRWAKERERKRRRARKAEKKLAKKLADKGGEKNISE